MVFASSNHAVGFHRAAQTIGIDTEPQPDDARQLATWISPRDMVHLVRCCIDAPDYRYLVLYGVSANTRARWKNPQAARIGYLPQDNAEHYAAALAGQTASGAATEFHGGYFCEIELTNKINNIDYREFHK